MKILIILTLAILASACGPNELRSLDNRSNRSDDEILAVVAYVQSIAPGTVDLTQLDMIVYADWHESREACGNDYTACLSWSSSDRTRATIHTPWQDIFEGCDRFYSYANGASFIAHELGHAYYQQTYDNADHNHDQHGSEWFGSNVAGSVVFQTFDWGYLTAKAASN